MRDAVGERVDPCWDPDIPGRPFCSWTRHREVETRGTEEEQRLLAGDAPAAGACFLVYQSSSARWNRGCFHRGENQDHGCEQVHVRAHGQTQRIQTQTWRQPSCSSCRNSASRGFTEPRRTSVRTRARLIHRLTRVKTILKTRSLKMEYLWKPGQVGTLPDLTYGRPSLGPSMKFCFFNIKTFPEVSRPWDCWPGGVCLQRCWESPRILFLYGGCLSLDLIASWNFCPSLSRPAAAACL